MSSIRIPSIWAGQQGKTLRQALRAWDVLPASPPLAGVALYGQPTSFTLNTTDSKLTNYGSFQQWSNWGTGNFNATTGDITIPETAIYRTVLKVLGTEASGTGGVDAFLKLDLTASPAFPVPIRATVDAAHVVTTSQYISMISVQTRQLFEGQVASLYMAASAALGLFSFNSTTFEVMKVAEA